MNENKVAEAYERTVADLAEYDAKDSSLSRDITNDVSDGRWMMEDRAIADTMTLKSLFYSEDWVYIVIDLIAGKISNQYLRVMKQTVVDGKFRVEPAENHPVQQQIDNPNPLQDYHAWMYSIVVDTTLCGNGIVWRRKTDRQMITIPVEGVSLDFDRHGVLSRYLAYDSGIFDGTNVSRRVLEFAPNEIIHVRRPNPSSLLWGLSPFVPGQKSVLFNRYSQEYLNSFYLKGATPGLALTMSQEANEAVALRMLRSFEMAYTGRRNQRRTMILPKGVTASPVAHTLADQRLEFHIDRNRESILALLKVPKQEVGLATTGGLGSEEYKTALKNFWASTLKPTMRMIAGALTLAFKQELGDRYFLEFDLGDVDVLQEDKLAKANLATAMKTTRTMNEIREEVWEVEPIEGGDALPGAAPMPSFGQPFSQPAQEPSQEPPATLAPETASLDLPDAKAIEEETKGVERVKRLIQSNADWFDKREEEIKKGVDKASDEVLKMTLAMFADQAETAVKLVKKYLEDEKNYEPAFFKSNGTGRRAFKAASIKDEEELRKRLEEDLEDFRESQVSAFVNALESTVELGYGAALNVPFKLPSENEIFALGAKGKKQRRALLEERGLRTFARINETTTNGIMSVIERGVKDGKSLGQIAKDIADSFRDVANIGKRAQVIARTETLTAVSIGQAAAMKDAGTVIKDLKKMWINAGDERVRGASNPRGLYKDAEKDHWKMQGDVAPHDKPFKNGLLYPRDPKGEASDVIQCFPASTIVHAIGTMKGFERFYSGPMITIQFKSGSKITGTPNHPVLTPKGWIGLGSLAKGDSVFKASGFDPNAFRNQNIKHIQSRIDEAFSSWSHSGMVMRVTGGGSADFHGDGSANDINVVNAKNTLEHGGKSESLEVSVNLGLPSSDLAHGSGFSDGGKSVASGRVDNSHSGISRENLSLPLFGTHSAPLDSLGFTSTAGLNPNAVQTANDSGSGDAKSPADLGNGQHLIDVHIDDVVSVDVDPEFSGHVYNLHTLDGYYIADGVLVHNCRCTWIMLPDDQMKEIADDVNDMNTPYERELGVQR